MSCRCDVGDGQPINQMSLVYEMFCGYGEDDEPMYANVPLLEALRDGSMNWDDYYHYDEDKQESLNALIENCKEIHRVTLEMSILRPELKDKYVSDAKIIEAKLEIRAKTLLRKGDVIEATA